MNKQILYLCSTVALLGYLPQDIVGTSIFDYYHPDDLPQLLDIYKKGEGLLLFFLDVCPRHMQLVSQCVYRLLHFSGQV